MERVYSLPEMKTSTSITGAHQMTVEPAWTSDNHSHPVFEFLYCIDGRFQINVNGCHYRLGSREGLLIGPHRVHNFINNSQEPCTFFTFQFDLDECSLRYWLCQEGEQIVVPEDQTETGLDEFYTLIAQQSEAQDDWNQTQEFDLMQSVGSVSLLKIQGYFLLLLSELVDILKKKSLHKEEKKKKISYEKYEVAHKIASNLENHVEEHVLISKIAEELYMSVSNCNKHFTAVFGISPKSYLNRIKINTAKRYLSETKMGVEEISRRLSFSSASHFSRQFKKLTGVSPIQFRINY